MAAPAGADPITGGETRLKPDRDTFEAFADMGIRVEPTGAAKINRRGAKFPIRGGHVTATNRVDATLQHAGGLALVATGGPDVKVSKFRIEIGRKIKLFARSGTSELRFLNLSPVDISGSSNSLSFDNAQATLAKQGATILSEAFETDIDKGVRLGKISVDAEVN